MAREVNQDQSFQDKLVKLIPTEIVGAYMVLAGLLGYGAATKPAAGAGAGEAVAASVAAGAATTGPGNAILIQVVFFALLVATPLYLWKVSGVTYKVQIAVTTIAFGIWVYTLGGPFVVWNLYYPNVGSIILVLWSIFVPMLVNPTPPVPPPA